MTSSRHLIPDDTYEELQRTSAYLGYTERGKRSKWTLLAKFLAYAKEHPSIFKI